MLHVVKPCECLFSLEQISETDRIEKSVQAKDFLINYEVSPIL